MPGGRASRRGSISAASAWWARRRCAGSAPLYTADLISGWRNRAWGYITITLSAWAGSAAAGRIPRRAAALVTSRGSPEGSAAAISSSVWVQPARSGPGAGNGLRGRRLSGSGWGGRPAPDSSAAVSSPASSMIASGHPCVSVTIRLASWGSSGPPTMTSAARARRIREDRRHGYPECPPATSGRQRHHARRIPARSARRTPSVTTMARISRDSWSSHCASSTTHSSGAVAAGIGEERECGQANGEAVRGHALDQAEGGAECPPRLGAAATRPAWTGTRPAAGAAPRNRAPTPTRRRRHGRPGIPPPNRRRSPRSDVCRRLAHPRTTSAGAQPTAGGI